MMRPIQRMVLAAVLAFPLMRIVIDTDVEHGEAIFWGAAILMTQLVYHLISLYSSDVAQVQFDGVHPISIYKEKVEKRKRFGEICFLGGLSGMFLFGFIFESVIGFFAIAVFLYGAHVNFSKQCAYCGKINNFVEEVCRNCENQLK